ncbi:MarR family winged helix-turn-helix transcriptional regulator [Microbacterium sp. SSM24]|uniref:MarR family winged helix-turn-helix transcriptional regulator n=1 Tax=Microbacterium sp. SSM24 TaxID=2991714 RepID=UPI002227A1C8|nr:MarR family transcriptional regulator [Microbacterium sp. SSM24]MCW3492694.1 MarR family transcriptional regulator [Microbacterium sp. SSM24]
MDALRYDERVAVARLRALLELLPTALDRRLADAGIGSFEFTLLEALHEAELRRLRLTALAARTNATLPRLSRVVTGLERKGLVTRAACEEDGRATNAVLTDAGEAVYSEAAPLYERAVRETILDGLDGDGVQQLAGISFAILDKLDPDRRLAVSAPGGEAVDRASQNTSASRDDSECAADPAAT